MASNRVIGDSKTNAIPWHVPGEQQRFKEETMGYHLIMGRKTYESIGQPLPGRRMVIISRNKDYHAKDCRVAHSPVGALEQCNDCQKVFIIGGEAIYRQTMEFCSHIILTTLVRPAQGDLFFPELPDDTFVVERTETILYPEPYTIKQYRRR